MGKVTSHERCVSCGQRMELSETGCLDHHCTAKHEKLRDAANRREQDTHEPRTRSFDERLGEGFALLGPEE